MNELALSKSFLPTIVSVDKPAGLVGDSVNVIGEVLKCNSYLNMRGVAEGTIINACLSWSWLPGRALGDVDILQSLFAEKYNK